MTDWAIPQQAKLTYTQLFNLHDRTRSGFLSGLQCRDILLQSGLPRNVLAEIWNLSDIDGDGQLTREEFILALYLTNSVRSGQPLPTELPEHLVPPSYKRARSVSTTSVNSNTSATSSSSRVTEDSILKNLADTTTGPAASSFILNSNTFEDKRRENYEKGRAELERRRVKIIDEQLELLEDRVNGFKSQINDAKVKIDSMRPDRDSKMGFITSLEAQLKTVQDRKAYLHQEEIDLIAFAQDLNLINPAQAELNQLAVDAKKQDIEKLKKDLEEVTSEKERKVQELNNLTKKLEEGKLQLQSIYQSANQTYETYKKKVEDAREIRAEAKIEAKYRAIYAFVGRDSDELTINPGDIITGTNQECDPGWISGRLNGSTGLFPEAYVELITDGNIEADLVSPIDQDSSLTAITTTTTTPITNFVDSREPLKAPSLSIPVTRYKTLFTFEARSSDELTINPDDILVGLEGATDPGWLLVELNGRRGLIPETYVEKLPDLVQDHNQPSSSKTRSKRAEVATAIANYRALGQEQLNLEKGQLVKIRRKMDSGWWEGEVQVKGRKKEFGWFPASYVKLLSSGSSKAED